MAATKTRASKTKTVNGRVVSAKSKTGDPACSQAMSEWKTTGLTPAISAILGKCRAKARALKQGESQRAAGNEAKAQRLEALAAGKKGPITAKDRLAKAKELVAARAASKSAAAQGAPGPREQAAASKTAKGTLSDRLASARAKINARGDAIVSEAKQAAAAYDRYRGDSQDKLRQIRDRMNAADVKGMRLGKASAKVREMDQNVNPSAHGFARGSEQRKKLATTLKDLRSSQQAANAQHAKSYEAAKTYGGNLTRKGNPTMHYFTKAGKDAGLSIELRGLVETAKAKAKAQTQKTNRLNPTVVKPAASAPKPSLRAQADAFRAAKGTVNDRLASLSTRLMDKAAKTKDIREKVSLDQLMAETAVKHRRGAEQEKGQRDLQRANSQYAYQTRKLDRIKDKTNRVRRVWEKLGRPVLTKPGGTKPTPAPAPAPASPNRLKLVSTRPAAPAPKPSRSRPDASYGERVRATAAKLKDRQFAGVVQKTADANQFRNHEKAFISDVYAALPKRATAYPIDKFKADLFKQHQDDKISLSRADMTSAFPADKHSASSTKTPYAEFHFVQASSLRPKAAGKAQPAPSKPSLKEQSAKFRAAKGLSTEMRAYYAQGAKESRKIAHSSLKQTAAFAAAAKTPENAVWKSKKGPWFVGAKQPEISHSGSFTSKRDAVAAVKQRSEFTTTIETHLDRARGFIAQARKSSKVGSRPVPSTPSAEAIRRRVARLAESLPPVAPIALLSDKPKVGKTAQKTLDKIYKRRAQGKLT